MRLPKVRELGPEPPHPPSLIGPQQLGFCRLGEGQVVLGVPATGLLDFAALLQLLTGVLVDGLKHREA